MQSVSLVNEHSLARDRHDCRRTLRVGSRTFFAASMFLPARTRASAVALYAFCRLADDAIDQGAEPARELDALHARLDSLYAGRPSNHPADRAFADCVIRHAIPKSLPMALLDGFSWDAAGRRYDSIGDVRAYGVRVAGSVGVMMAMIMGVRDPRMLAGACDLGVAMQLTNIARDVGEDAVRGRIYLPLTWLRDLRIDPVAWLREPIFTAEIGALVARLLTVAEGLYARSDVAIRHLPAVYRPGIIAARLLYAEIGHELARRGHDSVTQRTVVSGRRKAAVLMAAAIASSMEPMHAGYETLPEADYLLKTVPPGTDPIPSRPHASVSGRVHWVIDLFERLERRDLAVGRR